MDEDAEWFDVDQEFGPPRPQPRPRPRPRPRPAPTTTLAPPRPHEEHDEAMPAPVNDYTSIIAGVVSGLLGIVLILLIVYLVFLRKRLTKVEASRGSFRGSARGASAAPTDDDYRIRVDDIAHLSNLDDSSNTYVNTTDLQRLVSSVKAKKKAQEKPAAGQSNGPSRVVVRPPMAPPKTETAASSPRLPPKSGKVSTDLGGYSSAKKTDTPAVAISNVVRPVISTPVLISSSADLPKLPTPPKKSHKGFDSSSFPTATTFPSEDPSAMYENCATNLPVEPTSPTVARPAPPPPVGASGSTMRGGSPPCDNTQTSMKNQVPPPLPDGPKPSKPQLPTLPKPNIKPHMESSAQPIAKPTPPTLPKPKGPRRGNPGLPPLKLALLPSSSFDSSDNCETPDTAIIELTPAGSPTNSSDVSPLAAGGTPGSIGARIALLEGKMKTPALPARALHQ